MVVFHSVHGSSRMFAVSIVDVTFISCTVYVWYGDFVVEYFFFSLIVQSEF